MVFSEGGRVPCMFVHESALTHVGTKKPTAERSHKTKSLQQENDHEPDGHGSSGKSDLWALSR
jgi:hypothetical protein